MANNLGVFTPDHIDDFKDEKIAVLCPTAADTEIFLSMCYNNNMTWARKNTNHKEILDGHTPYVFFANKINTNYWRLTYGSKHYLMDDEYNENQDYMTFCSDGMFTQEKAEV